MSSFSACFADDGGDVDVDVDDDDDDDGHDDAAGLEDVVVVVVVVDDIAFAPDGKDDVPAAYAAATVATAVAALFAIVSPPSAAP